MKDSIGLIDELKKEVIKIFGGSLDSPTDFDALAAEIQEKTGRYISSTTLKRVFGYIKTDNAPSGNTLGILARYCGYTGWGDWCSRHGAEEAQDKVSNKKKAKRVRCAVISSAALLAIAATLFLIPGPWTERHAALPASGAPVFEENDNETKRYHDLMEYCTSIAAAKCDSVRIKRNSMVIQEYYNFVMLEYSRILDDMKNLAGQCVAEAFRNNDTLQNMYSAQIFSNCREVCLPLYIETVTEFQDSLNLRIGGMQ